MIFRKKIKPEPWKTWEEYTEDPTQDENCPPTIYRLNRMMALGFKVEYFESQNVPDHIYLRHPNRKLPHREFHLDGRGFMFEDYAEPLSGEGRKQLRFPADKGKEFEDFCRTIVK